MHEDRQAMNDVEVRNLNSGETTGLSDGDFPWNPDKRKHGRVRVQWPAYIRHPSFNDEIAVTENVSRGGVCFRSRQPYPVGSLIQLALPYSPGATNIFVPARIVYSQESPNKKNVVQGAIYVKL
jgi:hypothetical protein